MERELENSKERGEVFRKQYLQGIEDEVDLIELLKEIKGVACNHQSNIQGTYALVQLTKTLWTHIQLPHLTNNQYMENFNALMEVIKLYGRSFTDHQGLIQKKLESTTGVDAVNLTNEQRAAAVETVKKEYLACMFISGVDNGRYQSLKNELNNDFAKGTDSYP